MKRILVRVTAVAVVALLVLAVTEIGLRQFFGNLGLAEIMQAAPGDGRCVGLRPDASVVYTGHWRRTPPVVQEVNALGFRGPAAPAERTRPVVRIATVGDSFTYGVGVTYPETFSARMDDALRRADGVPIEVLNFGVPGLNLDEIHAQTDLFVRRWTPDIVLYFFWGNDHQAPLCGGDSWGRLVLGGGTLKFLNRLTLFRIPLVAWSSRSARPSRIDPNEFKDRLTRDLVSFAGHEVAAGSRFAVITLDDPLRRLTGGRHTLAAQLKANGVPALDLGHIYADSQNVLPEDRHFSARGHRLVAEAVTAWVEDLVPPSARRH